MPRRAVRSPRKRIFADSFQRRHNAPNCRDARTTAQVKKSKGVAPFAANRQTLFISCNKRKFSALNTLLAQMHELCLLLRLPSQASARSPFSSKCVPFTEQPDHAASVIHVAFGCSPWRCPGRRPVTVDPVYLAGVDLRALCQCTGQVGRPAAAS